jgi:putative ABC transport system permease protein
MRTLWNLIHVQPGFEAENVLTMPISLSRLQLENRPAPVFFAELIERIHVLPGVTGVGLTSHLPLEINDSRTGMAIEGRDPDPAEPTRAHWRIVSPEYFDTMRIRLVEGRLPAVSDLARGDAFSPVVLVNRTAARRYWPGQSPVGKRVQMFGGWREIVGIVDDVKHWGLGQSVNPEAYLPGLGTPVILGLRSPTILVIRTARDPVELAAAIRQEVRQIDANLPISTIRPMADVVSQSVASPRFYLILLVLFGTVAVILAAAGIYGVVSYTVAQSTREIGMRIALGARPRDVTRTIVGHGLILTLVSVAIGIVASIGLTRMMRALLFGVESTDPMTFAATAAFTGAVALLACYVPARRAAKVDPIVALRHQ